jgi:uncharacterized membrane protein YeaQ/YmgE (transglycosylase-associated protein family)
MLLLTTTNAAAAADPPPSSSTLADPRRRQAWPAHCRAHSIQRQFRSTAAELKAHQTGHPPSPGDIMIWLVWLLIEGLIIGVLGKVVAPGRNPVPIWLTILIGIAGAFIGNWISNYAGVRHTDGIDWIRHILQVVVAAVLVALATPAYSNRRRRI